MFFFFKRNSVCLCDCLNLQRALRNLYVPCVCVCALAARMFLSFPVNQKSFMQTKKKCCFDIIDDMTLMLWYLHNFFF